MESWEFEPHFVVTVNGKEVMYAISLQAEVLEIEISLRNIGMIPVRPPKVFMLHQDICSRIEKNLQEISVGVWRFRQIILMPSKRKRGEREGKRRTYHFVIFHRIAHDARNFVVEVL